ncbi:MULTISPECIES: hypothetical protein [unclassified Streptomyces]|uniref:DUF7848 domain-containing protein n=1 Tax=unclassified Streptomyces TaxID=2593676 RepID=UPI0016616CE3|nr:MULTISPECIES: hypothetical protein [unclassified Streptomyces]
MRFVEWSIGADPDRPAPTRHSACKICTAISPVSTVLQGPDEWALRHAGRTGHREFREIVSADLIARPKEER